MNQGWFAYILNLILNDFYWVIFILLGWYVATYTGRKRNDAKDRLQLIERYSHDELLQEAKSLRKRIKLYDSRIWKTSVWLSAATFFLLGVAGAVEQFAVSPEKGKILLSVVIIAAGLMILAAIRRISDMRYDIRQIKERLERLEKQDESNRK